MNLFRENIGRNIDYDRAEYQGLSYVVPMDIDSIQVVAKGSYFKNVYLYYII